MDIRLQRPIVLNDLRSLSGLVGFFLVKHIRIFGRHFLIFALAVVGCEVATPGRARTAGCD
jgi:hypothetical protein